MWRDHSVSMGLVGLHQGACTVREAPACVVCSQRANWGCEGSLLLGVVRGAMVLGAKNTAECVKTTAGCAKTTAGRQEHCRVRQNHCWARQNHC